MRSSQWGSLAGKKHKGLRVAWPANWSLSAGPILYPALASAAPKGSCLPASLRAIKAPSIQ
jgi:hypothetical protein